MRNSKLITSSKKPHRGLFTTINRRLKCKENTTETHSLSH